MSDTALPPVLEKNTVNPDTQLLQVFELYKNDFISFGASSLKKDEDSIKKLDSIEKALLDSSENSMVKANDTNSNLLDQLTSLNQNVLAHFNFQKESNKKDEAFLAHEVDGIDDDKSKEEDLLIKQNLLENQKSDLLDKERENITMFYDKMFEENNSDLSNNSEDNKALSIIPTKNSIKKEDPGSYYLAEVISSDLTDLMEQNDDNQEKLIELQEDEAENAGNKGKKSLSGIMALAMPAMALIMSLVASGVLPDAIELFKKGLKDLPGLILTGLTKLVGFALDAIGGLIQDGLIELGRANPIIGKFLGLDDGTTEKDFKKASSTFNEDIAKVDRLVAEGKATYNAKVAELEAELAGDKFSFFRSKKKVQKELSKLQAKEEEGFKYLEESAQAQKAFLKQDLDKKKKLYQKVSGKSDKEIRNDYPVVSDLKATSVNDAIITKDGQIIHTDEDDNLIATKNDVRMTSFDENSTNDIAKVDNLKTQESIELLKTNNMLLEKLTILLESSNNQPVVSTVNNANMGSTLDTNAIRNMLRKK